MHKNVVKNASTLIAQPCAVLMVLQTLMTQNYLQEQWSLYIIVCYDPVLGFVRTMTLPAYLRDKWK